MLPCWPDVERASTLTGSCVLRDSRRRLYEHDNLLMTE